MLFLVGLGLGDERDITLRGLEAVQKCDEIWLENYTSILLDSTPAKLEALYGKSIRLADREQVEQSIEEVLARAKEINVAFLVVGDPFGATTHSDLVLRASELQVPFQVIHNASIMNSIAECGLQLYSFGPCISIPLWLDGWKPQSFYPKIAANRTAGSHTLCLLDIKVKEQSLEDLAKGNKRYQPPRFMTIAQALDQLMQVEEQMKEGVICKEMLAVGIARLGTASQVIAAGTVEALMCLDFGAPLHSLVIPGKMHELEFEVLRALYSVVSPDKLEAAYKEFHQ
jgi:diphthine synthase